MFPVLYSLRNKENRKKLRKVKQILVGGSCVDEHQDGVERIWVWRPYSSRWNWGLNPKRVSRPYSAVVHTAHETFHCILYFSFQIKSENSLNLLERLWKTLSTHFVFNDPTWTALSNQCQMRISLDLGLRIWVLACGSRPVYRLQKPILGCGL